ncbi:MAG TPA: ATP-grasp domain-containing protein [Rugosimonospora sp.]|nr:ATP-grasp domain-containing protein [Rugosimonospora sp.]
MRESPADFNSRIKTMLAGTPDASLVFLGNFEVEEQWGRGEHRLPRFSSEKGTAVVHAMDEFALLLAGPGDHVVLRSAPDEGYLDYLRGLGIALPGLHVAAPYRRSATVTEAALADPVLLDRLAALAGAGCRLAPHGVSASEELLAERTGLPLMAPPAPVCRAVNSKIYSRRVADEVGLRQPPGWVCETVGDLARVLPHGSARLAQGYRLVLKEAFGVSGKGLAVLDRPHRLERLYRMIEQRAGGSPDAPVAFVLEQWVDKQADLNYQFTVGVDGSVHFDAVKQAITEQGVHKGHLMPADLSTAQYHTLVAAADLLGKRLAADGYFGVVGVDALVEPDGEIYPVIEINARNNMSTYQVRLQERFVGPGQRAMARHYPVRLDAAVGFTAVARALGDRLLRAPGGHGLLVNNFATVNAAAGGDGPFDGRLYGIAVADSPGGLGDIDADVRARLANLTGAIHG